MLENVTIGIPVYNEVERIERAIRTAAPQCGRLIVGDNASTDGTDEICRTLAAQYPNLEYIRHATNLGAAANSRFLLERATSPYFMFLGSHDHIEADYIEAMLGCFDSPAIECAFGALIHDYDDGRRIESSFGRWTGGMLNTPCARLSAMLYSRVPVVWAMYGLYRREFLQAQLAKSLPEYGIDVIFLARLLRAGKLAVVKEKHYYGWMRCEQETTTDYFERITARQPVKNKRAQRNAFRIAQHQEILAACKPGFADQLLHRLRSSIHFGTFKYPGLDPAYWLTWLPAKIARRIIALRCRWLHDEAV